MHLYDAKDVLSILCTVPIFLNNNLLYNCLALFKNIRADILNFERKNYKFLLIKIKFGFITNSLKLNFTCLPYFVLSSFTFSYF